MSTSEADAPRQGGGMPKPGMPKPVMPKQAMEKPKVPLWNDPVIRGYVFQVCLFIVLALLVWVAASNAIENLRKQGIASGYGFWDVTAGFDISMRLLPYEATSHYGQAFWVGLLNTLLVAVIGIVLATLLGFTIGVARLSRNWLVAKLAGIYVEVIRNTPLLLQLLFWYNAVLKALPEVRDSVELKAPMFRLWPELILLLAPIALIGGGIALMRRAASASAGWIGGIAMAALGAAILIYDILGRPFEVASIGAYLNNRGLFVPEPVTGAGFSLTGWSLLAGMIGFLLFRHWAHKRQEQTGEQAPLALVGIGLILVLPILVFLVTGRPLSFNYPDVGRFNVRGGVQIYPEFVALLVGLVIYTAAFIAEVVRAGILAVSKGQTEAAYSLGLRPGPTLKLVVIPQAMRVIIPPLTSQYLNLAKNSSLAVAIGYPDLVQVTNTIGNQTKQPLEVIALTMAVYLTISIGTSLIMNWYNARKALVER